MAQRLNLTKLAVALELSRPTLRAYLAREGAPKRGKDGKFPVEAARAWAESCAASARAGNTAVAGSEASKLRERRLALEVEAMEREAAIESGKLVDVAKIEPAIRAAMTELTANLRAKFEQELPSRYKGRSLAECQQMNAAAVDWALERLRDGLTAAAPRR